MKSNTRQILLIVGVTMAYAFLSIRGQYDNLIARVSRKYGNDPNIIRALISVESNGKKMAHNTSGEDSRGLGQINKPTALLLGRDPGRLFEPEYNIVTMNLLLNDLKKRYSSNLSIISAYNMGSVKRRKTGPLKGAFLNNNYVTKVHSKYLLYTWANTVPDLVRGLIT